ncbi:hypothetical protein ACFWBF_25935 [Streptomyces sp. NPDC060028]|uniref:hypothetical protein n=1 Tax=Streptomyces sp. NPDC060028 TaxID=3347041 RepID=UPI003674955E
MKSRTVARVTAATAAALGLTLGLTGQASAQWQHLFTYQTANLCASSYAEVSDGAENGGYSATGALAYNNNCNSLASKSAGWINAKNDLLVFDMPSGVWYLCATSGWWGNQIAASQLWISADFYRRCGGDHWYATNSGGYVWDGGAWRGGWVVSGNHWIGSAFAPAGSAIKAPAAPKVSAVEAVKGGDVRLGSPTGPKLRPEQLNTLPGQEAAPVKQLAADTYTVTTR